MKYIFFIHLYNITKNEQNLRISLPGSVRFSQKMALTNTFCLIYEKEIRYDIETFSMDPLMEY